MYRRHHHTTFDYESKNGEIHVAKVYDTRLISSKLERLLSKIY
jgi:hypothetical protein